MRRRQRKQTVMKNRNQETPTKMRAIVRQQYGGPEALVIQETSVPQPRSVLHPEGIDAVLELVGSSTILDSLTTVRRGGRVCLAGFLGGLAPIESFNPPLQMPSGVHLSFFGSFMFGTPEFPLSDVPLQTIVDRVASGAYKSEPGRVFRFEEIREAHRVIESNQANGKLVVQL
jgi:NADPH2:quinone reductase